MIYRKDMYIGMPVQIKEDYAVMAFSGVTGRISRIFYPNRSSYYGCQVTFDSPVKLSGGSTISYTYFRCSDLQKYDVEENFKISILEILEKE